MNIKLLSVILLTITIILTPGCTGNKSEKKAEVETVNEAVVQSARTPAVIGNETKLLLRDLEENGDYVNSQFFPSLIKASVV